MFGNRPPDINWSTELPEGDKERRDRGPYPSPKSEVAVHKVVKTIMF